MIWVYAGYPVFLFIFSLFKSKIVKKGDLCPLVSIFIPAYNEESVIKEKVKNCLALNYSKEKIEFIFILDGCSDKTERIISSFSDERIKIIRLNKRSGKVVALSQAAKKAKGEVFIFTDANAFYDEEAIIKLIAYFVDDRVGGVCGRLIYRERINDNAIEPESVYWKYEDIVKVFESKINTLVTANGAIYAIRKDIFEVIDSDLADDLVVPINIASKGKRMLYEKEAKAYENPPEKAKEEFTRRIRIVNQGFRATFRQFDNILRGGFLFVLEYLSHKFLRWLSLLFMVVIFITNILLLENTYFAIFFIFQLVFYVLASIGFVLHLREIKVKIFILPFYFCLLNIAAFCGIISIIFKTNYKFWEKAESTR
jgi:cellulose synthase/poly-beta-1,6-N-acetylglucosamine synthase-like glycosyltransferase